MQRINQITLPGFAVLKGQGLASVVICLFSIKTTVNQSIITNFFIFKRGSKSHIQQSFASQQLDPTCLFTLDWFLKDNIAEYNIPLK